MPARKSTLAASGRSTAGLLLTAALLLVLNGSLVWWQQQQLGSVRRDEPDTRKRAMPRFHPEEEAEAEEADPLQVQGMGTKDSNHQQQHANDPAPWSLEVLLELVRVAQKANDSTTSGIMCKERPQAKVTLRRFVPHDGTVHSAATGSHVCSLRFDLELAGIIRCSPFSIEFVPRLAMGKKRHRIGLFSSAATSEYVFPKYARHLASKFAWAERSGAPFLLSIVRLEPLVEELQRRGIVTAPDSDLGPWYRYRRVQWPTNSYVEAWTKVLGLQRLMFDKSQEWDFVMWLDTDTYVNRLDIPPRTIASRASRNIHFIVPLKSAKHRLQFSSWMFAMRLSPASYAFLNRWLAHKDCDCWVDQGPLWFTILRSLEVGIYPHACAETYSKEAKEREKKHLADHCCVNRTTDISAKGAEDLCCQFTRPGPMLCECAALGECFEDAVESQLPEDLIPASPASGNTTVANGGLFLPPVLWWADASVYDAQGRFSWVYHKYKSRK